MCHYTTGQISSCHRERCSCVEHWRLEACVHCWATIAAIGYAASSLLISPAHRNNSHPRNRCELWAHLPPSLHTQQGDGFFFSRSRTTRTHACMFIPDTLALCSMNYPSHIPLSIDEVGALVVTDGDVGDTMSPSPEPLPLNGASSGPLTAAAAATMPAKDCSNSTMENSRDMRLCRASPERPVCGMDNLTSANHLSLVNKRRGIAECRLDLLLVLCILSAISTLGAASSLPETSGYMVAHQVVISFLTRSALHLGFRV